jgi:hypothetical protein
MSREVRSMPWFKVSSERRRKERPALFRVKAKRLASGNYEDSTRNRGLQALARKPIPFERSAPSSV